MSAEIKKTNTTNLEMERQLTILNERLRKQTSVRYIFMYSVVRGIGYALGATIIAGAVLAFLLQVISSIDYLPLINQFLSSEEAREILNSFREM